MPRRKPGTLVPLETDILDVAVSMRRGGTAEFHGFGIASHLRDRRGSRSLTGHGTLYKALARLEAAGLLASRWETAADAPAADTPGRPRRRLYQLTPRGIETIEHVLAERASAATSAAGRATPAPSIGPASA